MRELETFILWHYQSGSIYNTPFWEYAKSLPFNPDSNFISIFKSPMSWDDKREYLTGVFNYAIEKSRKGRQSST